MSTIKKLSCKITAVTISFIMILCVLVSFPVSVSAENEIDYPGMAESLAYFINIEREKAGLEPLKVVPYLNSLAAVRALECTIKFSHDRPEYSIDENGEEFFFSMKIAVPRGTRNGEGGYIPYDGYAAAEDYRLEMEDKAAKKAASAEKKAAAEREKERKREAKKVVKDLNEKGFQNMVKETE